MSLNFFESSTSKKKALLGNFEEEKDCDKFLEIADELGLNFIQQDFEGLSQNIYLDLVVRLNLAPWKLVFDAVLSEDQQASTKAGNLIKCHFQSNYQCDDLAYSIELLSKPLSDQSFLRGWSMIMYAYGPNLHRTDDLNRLLQLIESYFTNPSFETRAAAFKSWKYLIYNLNLNKHIIARGRIKLLLIPIWNALVHEQNLTVIEESHSALVYLIAILSANNHSTFFQDFCLPLQKLAIKNMESINLLSTILLKVIDKHDNVEIDSIALLDSDTNFVLKSINSCHVYKSWSDEDVKIAQETLSILDNPHAINIYTILVDLAQYRLDNLLNSQFLTMHIQFLIKFCTDRSSNPNFGVFVSSFLKLEPRDGFIKQMLDGLKLLSSFVTNGTRLKMEINAKLSRLSSILISERRDEIPLNTTLKESSVTPAKRVGENLAVSNKRPLTERQLEPRSETLHNMYNSMVQTEKLQDHAEIPKENVKSFKDYLASAVERLDELDTFSKGELVGIQADLVAILAIITRKFQE